MTTTTTHPLAWCPTCRTRQPIMDQYATDTGDRLPAFASYTAQPLECGHDAGDAAPAPRFRTQVDAGLVDRLVALQNAARNGVIA